MYILCVRTKTGTTPLFNHPNIGYQVFQMHRLEKAQELGALAKLFFPSLDIVVLDQTSSDVFNLR